MPPGCPLQLCGRSGDQAPVSFAYHRDERWASGSNSSTPAMRDGMQFLFETDAGAS